jgi:predicted ferric reductase
MVATVLIGLVLFASFFLLPIVNGTVRYERHYGCIDCGYQTHDYTGMLSASLYFLKCGIAYNPTLKDTLYQYTGDEYTAVANSSVLAGAPWICSW